MDILLGFLWFQKWEDMKISMVSRINQTDCIDHDLATIAIARGTVRLSHWRLFRGSAAASEAWVAGRGLVPSALRLQALLQHLRRQGLGEALRRLQVSCASYLECLNNIWTWHCTCTASLSHLRTLLSKSSSRPLPAKWPNHAT